MENEKRIVGKVDFKKITDSAKKTFDNVYADVKEIKVKSEPFQDENGFETIEIKTSTIKQNVIRDSIKDNLSKEPVMAFLQTQKTLNKCVSIRKQDMKGTYEWE